ncbi:PDZ domain-containing protein [Phycicoccus sp. BSK3Z-2]|uniref:endopeptidase La n=1 Tax=Phycicoccus avicenniae TaxID=2828860 RepID=A0A941DAG3_9MICO|nr:PDZ domain-containing protein [Phycicoccus avicenniae]
MPGAPGAAAPHEVGGSRGPAGPGRGVTALLVGLFSLVVVAAGLTFVPLPYVVLSPGPATNILGSVDGQPVLAVEGVETFPTDGALDFTTVAFDGGPGREVTVYDLLGAAFRPEVEVRPEELYFPPDASEEEVEAENAELMNDSQTVAAATALRALGRDVPTVVQIAEVAPDGPAAGTVEQGDVVLQVDGSPVGDAGAVADAVQDRSPGDDVNLRVRRDGAERTLTVPTGDVEGRAVIGVFLRTDYDLPVQVTLNTGRVGGPSAGLMFTLAIYDSLTPGALTGGERIAGTGTIADDGTVGPISGIRQKLVGAREAGAEWFLAPVDDCADAEGAVPDGMEVFEVGTFEEARAAVEAIAAGDTGGLTRCG